MTVLEVLIIIFKIIFDISWLVLLAVIAVYSVKSYNSRWLDSETAAIASKETNEKLDEILAFMKTTFNKEFASKVEDLIRMDHGRPSTMRKICDDGEVHEVPIDLGW